MIEMSLVPSSNYSSLNKTLIFYLFKTYLLSLIDKLMAAAQQKEDQRILVHFVTDAVAQEMSYHRRCYFQYVKDAYNRCSQSTSPAGYADIHCDCFCKSSLSIVCRIILYFMGMNKSLKCFACF